MTSEFRPHSEELMFSEITTDVLSKSNQPKSEVSFKAGTVNKTAPLNENEQQSPKNSIPVADTKTDGVNSMISSFEDELDELLGGSTSFSFSGSLNEENTSKSANSSQIIPIVDIGDDNDSWMDSL